MSELIQQLPESENERVIRWLRASVEYETLTPEEAGVYYSAYLDILEDEYSPLVSE